MISPRGQRDCGLPDAIGLSVEWQRLLLPMGEVAGQKNAQVSTAREHSQVPGRVARQRDEDEHAVAGEVVRATKWTERRTVEVDGRSVRVKLGRLDGRVVNVAPEHDDCAAVARATGTPIKSVWAAALAAASELT